MYDVIARTAGLILVGLMLLAILWSWLARLPLPTPWFIKRFWQWSMPRRAALLVGVLFFLMLVIEWASQHQQAR